MYLFTLEKDFSYYHKNLEGIVFENRWIRVKSGLLIVRQGYAWDGCSPKVLVADKWVIGIPDGKEQANGKPHTYYSSLIHDALTQFQDILEMESYNITEVFEHHLKVVRWPYTRTYVNSVSIYMAIRDFINKLVNSQT